MGCSSLTGNEFCDRAFELGYDFFTGVPDSTLAGIFRALEYDYPKHSYVVSVREDSAIGLAVGAHLGGRQPLVLMQNSGLGYCLTALTSLVCLYRIPLLLVIGWRGATGDDAPEHRLMGLALPELLQAIGVKFRAPSRNGLGEAMWELSSIAKSEKSCCALLIRDGVMRND
jgi:sulfopyruvate decarboxylase subunit alpha